MKEILEALDKYWFGLVITLVFLSWFITDIIKAIKKNRK